MLTFRLIIAVKKKGNFSKKQLRTPMPLQGGRWDSAECECVCGSSGGIQKMLFADDQPAGRENFRIKSQAVGSLPGVLYQQQHLSPSITSPPTHPTTTLPRPNAELSDFMTDKRTAGEGLEGGSSQRMRGAGQPHRSDPLRGGVMDGHNIQWS